MDERGKGNGIVTIERCSDSDTEKLACLNKQLIEDEKSDNAMDIGELADRMRHFLETDYEAYFFKVDGEVIGYALVNVSVSPVYLRQFLIDRKVRRNRYGQTAFGLLTKTLKTESMDVEVLSWNEAGRKFWESLGFVERSRYLRLSK